MANILCKIHIHHKLNTIILFSIIIYIFLFICNCIIYKKVFTMRGGEAIIESLKNMGVKTIFGYPGGQTIPFYDMLYDADMEHILVRHEQCAAHAADGYARATGKVGVCMATSGPGATNLVTGIATAYMDSVPMVAITANVNLPALGKDSSRK
jgi:acetolactate synthase-1/2/3 large subunit